MFNVFPSLSIRYFAIRNVLPEAFGFFDISFNQAFRKFVTVDLIMPKFVTIIVNKEIDTTHPRAADQLMNTLHQLILGQII